MGKILVLDRLVANQIAAGEVVERPASVVRELVENALDAGAAEIRIAVSQGGLEEIRVLDDGEGMDRDDMALSLERHATSKIQRLEQLATLDTLGFRGEALPSIASVSRMVLESSPDAAGPGTRVRVTGGKREAPEVVGHPRGTSVTVRSLFFNAPARRKFLRSPGTETGQIADGVSRIALAHFDRRFTLTADGRTLLDTPPAPDRDERVRQIFGEEIARQLVPFSREEGPYRASGFASRPDFTRSTTRHQWLFVNGRPVRDRGILHAISAAYHTLLPRGRHPFVLLFLEIPPERVDVNVHPAKAEVRLADPRAVYDTARRAIQGALRQERPVPRLEAFGPSPVSVEGEAPPGENPEAKAAGVWEFSSAAAAPGPVELFETSQPAGLGKLVPLGQYRESYILASDAEGLVIVDQHVAHERILYEQILLEAGRARVRRQALLFPITLDLDPAQARLLEERRGELERLGFLLEPFGHAGLLVREAPALLGGADLASLLRDLVDDLQEFGRARDLDRIWDRMAATTACHAAVKVNFPLTIEKMAFLLDELARTSSPMTCPHGRPIVLRFPHRDLEKSFHRR